MSMPTPIILCGRIPTHRAAVTEILKPEFEVVVECPTVDEIKQYLRRMVQGESFDQPTAIIVGAGFSDAEFEEARAAPGAETLVWMRADPAKKSALGPPPAEKIAKRVKEGFDDHMDGILHRKDVGKVWYY